MANSKDLAAGTPPPDKAKKGKTPAPVEGIDAPPREYIVCSSADDPYWVNGNGLFERGQKADKHVAFRPIWPSRRGADQDGEHWLEVSWIDHDHRTHARWIKDVEAREAGILQGLSGAPVDPINAKTVARFMGWAPSRIEAPAERIASRLGWIDGGYVWPGNDAGHVWVGADLGERGDLAEFRASIEHLVNLGEAGYLALCALAVSAASPLVRHCCRRNPILGLSRRSTRGKTTTVAWALSLWGDPFRLTCQAGSTPKGIQDLAYTMPDTPILVDDLHRLAEDRPDQCQDVLYFLGNGQRRVTSNRNKVAQGGERRYGAAFFAAEHEILPGMRAGAQFRTWEIIGDPLPDKASAMILERATKRGRGALGALLARHYEDRRERIEYAVSRGCQELATAGLAGEDVPAVNVLLQALLAVQEVASVEIPELEVVNWLASQIATQRSSAIDQPQAGWDALIDAVLGGAWTLPKAGVEIDGKTIPVHDKPDVLEIAGERIAWRWRQDPFDTDKVTRLEVHSASQWAARVTSRFGGETTLLKSWADKGWIVAQPPHLKLKSRLAGTRILRLSAAALETLNDGREP